MAKKITYLQLRKLIENTFQEYPDVTYKQKYSVINDGFPGTFNLSLNEPELLDTFGNYLNYDKPLYFAKIQPVIRPDDFEQKVLSKTSIKHLGLFEIAGISLVDTKSTNLTINTKRVINWVWKLLINKLNFDPSKIYVKLSSGGTIEKLTNGKYKINKIIEKDKLSYNYWKELGVPEKNFIWDNTRDTFLSLFMFSRPTPWGYRNEILYDIGEGNKEENLLDIGTIEHFPWKPIFVNEGQKKRDYMIEDIQSWENSVAIAGVGVERLLMVLNKSKNSVECSHIFPLFSSVLKDSKTKDPKRSFILTETIRVLHRVLTDSAGYVNLSSNRKLVLSSYINELYNSLKLLGIPLKNIKKYLKINSNLRQDYPELRDYDFIAREISYAFERRFEESPAFPRAEYYEGTEGLKQATNEILKEKGTPVNVFFSSKLADAVPFYSKYFRKTRIERKIPLRVLSDESKKIEKTKKKDKEELREIRYAKGITNELNSAVYIFRNKLAVITATERERGGIIIENKELSELMNKLFEKYWNSSKK